MIGAKFVIVVREREDGLYQVRYPDFKELTSIVDKLENIEKVSTKMLTVHLKEIRDRNGNIAYPISLGEVIKTKLAEEQCYEIESEIPDGLKIGDISTSLLNQEKVEEIAKKIGNKFDTALSQIDNIDTSKTLGVLTTICGILFLVSVLFPVASAEGIMNNQTEYFGIFKFGNANMPIQFYEFRFYVTFMYVLTVCSGMFSLYAGIVKNKFYIKAADIIAVLLFFLFILVFDVELARCVSLISAGVSKSYLFIFMLCGAIIAGIDLALNIARGEGK